MDEGTTKENPNILDKVNLGFLDNGTVAALYRQMQDEDLDRSIRIFQKGSKR